MRLKARKDDPKPEYPSDLNFVEGDDPDIAISRLDEELISAILSAARVAVGRARLNEVLATILVGNLCRAVTLEYLFNQRVNFDDPDFAFDGIRTVRETDISVDVKARESRPLDD